jgi:hypothetical protein
MHPVAVTYRGANALGAGDVNRDGFTDYVTNYEFDQRYVIALHPGGAGRIKEPWPAVVAWEPEPLANGGGVNPENAALGDFDGDGNLDVVAAQGWSNLPFWEGSEPGVRVVWGPPAGRLTEEGAWTDGGRIPATIDRGHLIYVVPCDVNGDGATDIVAGGRIHGGNGRKGGVIWIEAPGRPDERRDLSQWQVHDIDPDQFSGHGLVLADVDIDGDDDIALANADFDTPEEEEKVLWYENPGAASPAQRRPWPAHVIYEGDEFLGKPQIAAADLDGDGLDDLITQTARDVYWFRKTGIDPVVWERIVIPKDPVARWPARPIRAADLDGDGRLDLVGMLMHEDGDLPGAKAAAFWMRCEGIRPQADNWTTHVIKWGSGRTMLLPIFGEKWDQVQFSDLDRDGDLDIVANCEEWWEDDIEFRFFWDPRLDPQSVAVVWFENRLHEKPYAFREREGLCVMEAEQATDLRDGTWISRALYPGYAGDGYMQDHNMLTRSDAAWSETGGLEYAVEVAGGTYRVWVRRWVPQRWGLLLGRGESDSAWIGVDGRALGGPFDDKPAGVEAWTWVGATEPIELRAGDHTLSLRIREGGYAVDRILLSADPDFVPDD